MVLAFVLSFHFQYPKSWIWIQKLETTFSIFIFYEYEYNGIFVNIVKTQSYFFWVMWVCVSERSYFFFWNKKQWPYLGITYSIPKLCIQNNLSNTIKCEKKCNLGFEYRIKKMKSGYTTFWNQTGPKSLCSALNGL